MIVSKGSAHLTSCACGYDGAAVNAKPRTGAIDRARLGRVRTSSMGSEDPTEEDRMLLNSVNPRPLAGFLAGALSLSALSCRTTPNQKPNPGSSPGGHLRRAFLDRDHG